MNKTQHKRTAVASMFQNGISQNTKCAIKDGFRRDSHICDWISENQASTHNYKYLEIPIVIIWRILTLEGKQILAWNLLWFYSYL